MYIYIYIYIFKYIPSRFVLGTDSTHIRACCRGCVHLHARTPGCTHIWICAPCSADIHIFIYLSIYIYILFIYIYICHRFAFPQQYESQKKVFISERSLRVSGVLRVGNGMHGRQSAREKFDCLDFVASRALRGCRPRAYPLLIIPFKLKLFVYVIFFVFLFLGGDAREGPRPSHWRKFVVTFSLADPRRLEGLADYLYACVSVPTILPRIVAFNNHPKSEWSGRPISQSPDCHKTNFDLCLLSVFLIRRPSFWLIHELKEQ